MSRSLVDKGEGEKKKIGGSKKLYHVIKKQCYWEA